MTDHIDNRTEFEAQSAAACAVQDWIDKPPRPATEEHWTPPALIGCTPAMLSQIACNAYRDHLAEHGSTFTYDELRITLVAFAKWSLEGEIGEGHEVELVDRFIAETTADDEPPTVLHVVDGESR